MPRRVSIRTKLLLYLLVAGGVPLVVASYVALQVVRTRTDESLRVETERSLRIGLNLVLSRVQRVSADAKRLGQDQGIRTLFQRYYRSEVPDQAELKRDVGRIVARFRDRLHTGQVELLDRQDRSLTRQSRPADGAAAQGQGDGSQEAAGRPRRNRYLHSVDIVADGDLAAIRASAPVVDDDFEVLGTVVVTVPLDHRFADELRSTLVLHVGFYLGSKPAASSFRNERGGPVAGLTLGRDFPKAVSESHHRVTNATFGGLSYAVGALPLVNNQGKAMGLFYVALDRKILEAGNWQSYRSLLMGGAGVFLMAFLIASLASRGFARPLTLLHQRAVSVARGNLEGRIDLGVGGELGELGKAFDSMTESLRENQRRLAARISEIVTLHNIGRAVSQVVGLEDVLRTVVEEIRRALAAETTTILLASPEGRLLVRARAGRPEGTDAASSPDGAPEAGAASSAGVSAASSAGVSAASSAGAGAASSAGAGAASSAGAGAASSAGAGAASSAGAGAASSAGAGAASSAWAGPAQGADAAAPEISLAQDLSGPTVVPAQALARPTLAEHDAALAIGQAAFSGRKTLCIDDVENHPEFGELARASGLGGSMMVVPLEHKERLLGAMIINRRHPAPAFGEGELRLLATFANQASTAIENARLYEEVTVFNERLEHMVEERTAELTRANTELAHALEELQEAQAQVILSERLAGLGQLVAGIAHEVNTPAGAIQGAVENLDRCLGRLLDCARQLGDLGLSPTQWNLFLDEVSTHAARTELRPSLSPLDARQAAKDLGASLEAKGVPDARRLSRRLVDLDAADSATRLLELTGPSDVQPLVGCLQELVVLRRNALAIGTAITTINRIVSALRAYSHLDQTRVDRVNLHDGIETTLIILASRLKHDVTVTRRYGELPPMPIYVDELNQVWTNLLTNAADALEGRGEVIIETELLGDEAVVRVIDRGKGIAPEILPRIFKPFFTTKPKGKGTGLGLGICRRIVEKHGGRIVAESEPGRSCFSVFLPVAGPPVRAEASPPDGQASPGPEDRGEGEP